MKNFVRRSWLLGFVITLTCATAGFADTIDFTTTGTFSGAGCSGSTCASSGASGVTLSFTGVNASVAPNNAGPGGSLFTFNSLGQFQAGQGDLSSFDGVSFTLNIAQSTPPSSPSNGNLMAQLSGSIQTTSSGTEVIFQNPTSLTLGGVTYSIASFTADAFGDVVPGVSLVPYSSGGVTTVQGKISEVQAPEPSSILFIGSGLLVLGGTRRRWFH